MFWLLVYFPDIWLTRCTFTSHSRENLGSIIDSSLHVMTRGFSYDERTGQVTSKYMWDPQCSERIGLCPDENAPSFNSGYSNPALHSPSGLLCTGTGETLHPTGHTAQFSAWSFDDSGIYQPIICRWEVPLDIDRSKAVPVGSTQGL